jgi:transposase-like protein
MANKRHNPQSRVAEALRSYIECEGNCSATARSIGCKAETIQRWARDGRWPEILERAKREAEAIVASEAARALATIGELRVNIHYRSLSYIHQRLTEWERNPTRLGDTGELEPVPYPFDPLRLAEAMAKATPSGVADSGRIVVEDAVAAGA